MAKSDKVRHQIRVAKQIWKDLDLKLLEGLRSLLTEIPLLPGRGELSLLDGRWYVTHAGLLGLARRGRCVGIHVRPVLQFCDVSALRWAFEATVYKSPTCKGFVGYGDADPSNVSPLVHGAEMRVAETRAVNRALRKAYGIGICSVEEIGSFKGQTEPTGESKKRRSLQTEMATAVARSAIISAKSFVSISSMPIWSKPTLSISLAPRLCAMPRASKSKLSSRTWPTGPRKTAMPYSASSTAISARKKVQHETPDCRPPRRRSLRGRPNPRRAFSGSSAESLVPSTSTKAVLHSGSSHSRTRPIFRPCHFQPPLLQPESPLEVQLVPARLWLRCRTARSR